MKACYIAVYVGKTSFKSLGVYSKLDDANTACANDFKKHKFKKFIVQTVQSFQEASIYENIYAIVTDTLDNQTVGV